MADDNQADILEEHRRIHDALGRLEGVIGEPSVGPDWSGKVSGLLGELTQLLRVHFSGEAESSFFQEMMETEPRLANLLKKLAMEHSQILKVFGEGAKLAESADVTDSAQVLKVKRKVQLGMATLKRHEAEENELIMNAYWEDMGGAD